MLMLMLFCISSLTMDLTEVGQESWGCWDSGSNRIHID